MNRGILCNEEASDRRSFFASVSVYDQSFGLAALVGSIVCDGNRKQALDYMNSGTGVCQNAIKSAVRVAVIFTDKYTPL